MEEISFLPGLAARADMWCTEYEERRRRNKKMKLGTPGNLKKATALLMLPQQDER
jgi:hypothetical protein